jgi:hypothetical protein
MAADSQLADRLERLARIRRMLIGLLKRPSQSGARRLTPSASLIVPLTRD